MIKGAGIFAVGATFGIVVGGVAGLIVGASLAVSVRRLDTTITQEGVRFDFHQEGS